MRRTPYADRSPLSLDSQLRLGNQSSGLSLQGSFKQDPRKFNNNIALYLPSSAKSPTQHLYPRTSRSTTRRPMTVNKTYGDLKSRSRNFEIQNRKRKCYPSLTMICGSPPSRSLNGRTQLKMPSCLRGRYIGEVRSRCKIGKNQHQGT